MIIRYKLVNGEVVKEIVAAGMKRLSRGEDRPVRHFSEQLLRNYYEQECQQGGWFKSTYSKNVIKHVHDTALQRYDQIGQES